MLMMMPCPRDGWVQFPGQTSVSDYRVLWTWMLMRLLCVFEVERTQPHAVLVSSVFYYVLVTVVRMVSDSVLMFCVVLAGYACRRSTKMRTPPCGTGRAPEGPTSASSRRYQLLLLLSTFLSPHASGRQPTPLGYTI